NASSSACANLLQSPTSFVGREAALAALERLWDRTGLVTVLGPPGVGKTRLAKEHALRRLAEIGRGGAEEGRAPVQGAWFCDLTLARDIEGLCAAVGRAIDVPLTPGSAPEGAIGQLGAALEARGPLLLLLDNFEHLTASAPATVLSWRRQAP